MSEPFDPSVHRSFDFGKAQVLSTLSTPHLSTAKTEGIACSSLVQINTGTEP